MKKQLLDRSDRELVARMAKELKKNAVQPTPQAFRNASVNTPEAQALWSRCASATLASSRISSVTNYETGTTSLIKVRNKVDLERVGFMDLGHGIAKLGHSVWRIGQDGEDVVVERLEGEKVQAAKWADRLRKEYKKGSTIEIRGHLAEIVGHSGNDLLVEYVGSGIRDLQPLAKIASPDNDMVVGFMEQAESRIAQGTWSPRLTAEIRNQLSASDSLEFAQFVRGSLRSARKLASPSKNWTEWNGIWVRDYTDLLHGEIAMLPDVMHWELFATGELVEQGHAATLYDAQKECDQAANMQFPQMVAKKSQLNSDVIQEAYNMGQQAHRDGRSSAPAQDPNILELIRANSTGVGSSIPLLEAWAKGWHEANLALSVESRRAQYEHPKGDLSRLIGVTVINELGGRTREGEVIGVVDDALGQQKWVEVKYDSGNYGRLNPDVLGYDPNREAIVIVASKVAYDPEDPDEDFSPPEIPDEFRFKVSVTYMGHTWSGEIEFDNYNGDEEIPEYKVREAIFDKWLDSGGHAIAPDGFSDQQIKEFDDATNIEELEGTMR